MFKVLKSFLTHNSAIILYMFLYTDKYTGLIPTDSKKYVLAP